LVLGVVLAPALRRREHEPVAHVRHLARPALVELRLAFASAEALDDRLHLQELLLRVLLVLGSGDYALGARAQAREELAHVRVLSGLGEQADAAVRVVVTPLRRAVSRDDALSNL